MTLGMSKIGDKQGKWRSQQMQTGTNMTKKRQAGTRNISCPCLSFTGAACPWLSLMVLFIVPAYPNQPLLVPASLWLSPSLSTYTLIITHLVFFSIGMSIRTVSLVTLKYWNMLINITVFFKLLPLIVLIIAKDTLNGDIKQWLSLCLFKSS